MGTLLITDQLITDRRQLTPNEKATRQLGRPFLSRENSSNGAVKTHQNILRESYEPEKRGVKQNL